MIEQYELEQLCNKYGISAKKLVNRSTNILNYGEYKDIDQTLNYLINELNISTRNIEKCSSILYRNVTEIKKNVEFIKQTNLKFYDIEIFKNKIDNLIKKIGFDYVNIIENDLGLLEEII